MRFQELLIILVILFLLFGATRLPALGSSLGSAIRNFKKGFSGDEQGPEETKSNNKSTAALGSTSSTESKDSQREKAG